MCADAMHALMRSCFELNVLMPTCCISGTVVTINVTLPEQISCALSGRRSFNH